MLAASRLPSFVIIGAAKAATSSVRTLLQEHPQVFLAQGGVEPQFFARDDVYARGFAWYGSLFADAPDGALLGECSNIYTERERYPETASRLARHVPDAKLIYLVRDPLPRIASLWTQLRSHGGEDVHYDFATSIERDRELLIGSTNYWRQLEPYRRHFPDSRIQILFFEDFSADPEAVMAQICRFLEIDTGVKLRPEEAHQNRSDGKLGAPPWFSRLRASPTFRLLRRALPERLRIQVRKSLVFREVAKPVWTPELRRLVLDELRDDSHALLAHCGRPPSFWKLG